MVLLSFKVNVINDIQILIAKWLIYQSVSNGPFGRVENNKIKIKWFIYLWKSSFWFFIF